MKYYLMAIEKGKSDVMKILGDYYKDEKSYDCNGKVFSYGY